MAWIENWIADRYTTIAFPGYKSQTLRIDAGIPQGLLLSPILFLFYNLELLEICDKPGQGISAIGFVDNINILIYRKTTEKNTKKLEYNHKNYIK